MPALWQPGTQYNLGDEVEYEGSWYRIIQAHRSQGDWTPPVTPALWGKMQKPAGGSQGGYGAQPQQPQQPHAAPPSYSDKPTQGQGQGQNQGQGQGHGHGGGHDSDSDDGDGNKKKKIFGIAGGVAAGAALIGAGVFAYKHHEKHEDQKEGFEAWKRDAEQRTAAFQRDGPQGPTTWVLVHGKNYHQYAIAIGKESGKTLYAARAYHDGGLLIGKAGDVTRKGAAIGYKKKEQEFDVYEILIGNMNQLRWVRTSGNFKSSNLGGARPVEGGRENDGTPLYVVRAEYKGSTQPGKASEKLKGAYVPYANDEENVNEYEVLCHA